MINNVSAASLFAVSEESLGISSSSSSSEVEKIDFDLLIDESHTLEFDASDHPLENGAVITDHVTQKLRTCTITGMFTNHPAQANGRYDAKRALTLFNELENLAKKRKPVRLVTTLRVYEEMIITSLPVKITAEDGESITFTITLREFKVAALKKNAIFGKFKPKDMKTADNRTIAQRGTNGTVSAKQLEYTGYLIDGRMAK